MKTPVRISLLLSCLLALPLAAQTPLADAGPAFVVERTIWLRPGRTTQYLTLFERVEQPRLDALRRQGAVLWYRTARPVLAGRADDWDMRLTVAWRSAADAQAAAQAQAAGEGRPGRAVSPETERRLLEELVVDQQETWIDESAGGR